MSEIGIFILIYRYFENVIVQNRQFTANDAGEMHKWQAFKDVFFDVYVSFRDCRWRFSFAIMKSPEGVSGIEKRPRERIEEVKRT